MPRKPSDSPPDTSRETLLRDAAALARQGKLDQAVKQYEAALESTPDDWGTANLVGDLWLKLGDTAAAKRHFDNAAGRLADEGFHAKASALYKKILKIWPDDDNARVRAGEIAERQELFADSDTHYRAAIALRKARGDMDGAQLLEERLRVRHAGAEASSAAEPPPVVTEAASAAGERWARAVALTPEARKALIRELEIGAARPRPIPVAVLAYTTESWGGDLIATVVGALDTVEPAGVPVFDAVKCRASLEEGDAWRLAIRRAGRPEWLEAAESAGARAEAARAAVQAAMAPPADEAAVEIDVSPQLETEPMPALEPAPEDVEATGEFLELSTEPAVVEHHEPEPVPARVLSDRPDVSDINVLFEAMRTTFVAVHAAEARGWFARGRASMAAEDTAAGIPALERATSAMAVRGDAASILGRHYLHAGNPGAAVEWLERAAECPTDDAQAGQDLVYDIGCALEALGEDLRALAVFTELRRAAGGPCRDVNERIDRLSGLA